MPARNTAGLRKEARRRRGLVHPAPSEIFVCIIKLLPDRLMAGRRALDAVI